MPPDQQAEGFPVPSFDSEHQIHVRRLAHPDLKCLNTKQENKLRPTPAFSHIFRPTPLIMLMFYLFAGKRSVGPH